MTWQSVGCSYPRFPQAFRRATLFAALPPPASTKGSRRAFALLTIRKLSAQPRNHRHVDRVALGEPHAQVDHLFRALVSDLHSAALGIAQTNDLGFCLAQHRGSALDLACRLEAERGSLGVQSLHQIGHG